MSHPRLSAAGATWPTFVVAAAEAGFDAVDALPMKLRSDAIGASICSGPGTAHYRRQAVSAWTWTVAFTALRGYARGHNLKLAELARTIVGDRAWTHDLFSEQRRAPRRRSGSG